MTLSPRRGFWLGCSSDPGVDTPGYALSPRRGFWHDQLDGGGRRNIPIGGARGLDFRKLVDERAAQGLI